MRSWESVGGLASSGSLLFSLLTFVGAALAQPPPINSIGPPLTALQSKLADPNWLVAWLLKPSRLRPGTMMPDADLSEQEAQAIAGFLLANRGGAGAQLSGTLQGGDARVGERLFLARGCRGCHAIAAGDTSVSPRVPNLVGIGLKVKGDWLFNWLKSPRSYDAHTPMPQLVLSQGDIRHLVAFLLTRRAGAEVVAAAPRFNPKSATNGRALVERYECTSCHEVSGFPPPPPALRLSGDAGGGTDVALRDGRALVTYYNCRGCHRIEGSGGAIAGHLERKTFAPPTLDGEGARVQVSWLIEFLHQPTTLRPWLQIRMPSYGLTATETSALARYFAALAGVPATDEPVPPVTADATAHGLRRIAHFKCAQCHPTGNALPKDADLEDLSINLMLAKKRLRPSWIRQFLARPKAIVGTQTRMPTVFYSVDGTPKVDHPDDDIDAIAAYLMHMTEPLDVALAALNKTRAADGEKQQIDWSTYQY